MEGRRLAIALEPRYTLAHYRHAMALRELGREADALAALEDAVAAAQARTGPGSEVAAATMHAALGEALAARGDLVRARAEYESARAGLPGRPAVLFGLADVLEQLGDDREAAALHETLLARHPGHVRAAIGLAWLRASSDDPAVRDVAQARILAARGERAAAGAGPAIRVRAREARLAAEAELAFAEGTKASRARAIEHARRVLDLARRTGRPRSVAAARTRLVRFGARVD